MRDDCFVRCTSSFIKKLEIIVFSIPGPLESQSSCGLGFTSYDV